MKRNQANCVVELWLRIESEQMRSSKNTQTHMHTKSTVDIKSITVLKEHLNLWGCLNDDNPIFTNKAPINTNISKHH